MMAQVTQTLKLEETRNLNSRFFDEGKTLYPRGCQGQGICPRCFTRRGLAPCWALGNTC